MSERKPMFIIENHHIDRHIAAVGECLFMAHNSPPSSIRNRVELFFVQRTLTTQTSHTNMSLGFPEPDIRDERKSPHIVKLFISTKNLIDAPLKVVTRSNELNVFLAKTDLSRIVKNRILMQYLRPN